MSSSTSRPTTNPSQPADTTPWVSNGPILRETLAAPFYTLAFYSFGVILSYTDESTQKHYSYAIDPNHLATLFAQLQGYTTGILAEDILYASTQNGKEIQISYREPQITGIYLDGTIEPLRVPLPGLLLFQVATVGKSNTEYRVAAVHKRPANLQELLYHAPLPNIYRSTGICWGTVQKTFDVPDPTQATSLQAMWSQLLGSPFGNHAVSGKSQVEGQDIRNLLLRLDKHQTTTYPLHDLVPLNDTPTIRHMLEKLQ